MIFSKYNFLKKRVYVRTLIYIMEVYILYSKMLGI